MGKDKASSPLNQRALSASMARSSSLGAPAQCVFPLKDELTPFALGPGAAMEGIIFSSEAITTDDVRENLHPAFLVWRVVGVEVDDLAIVETHAEPLLNKHVTLFLFGKG